MLIGNDELYSQTVNILLNLLLLAIPLYFAIYNFYLRKKWYPKEVEKERKDEEKKRKRRKLKARMDYLLDIRRKNRELKERQQALNDVKGLSAEQFKMMVEKEGFEVPSDREILFEPYLHEVFT